MKINLATAVHCGALFHGGSCLTEALIVVNVFVLDLFYYFAVILFNLYVIYMIHTLPISKFRT